MKASFFKRAPWCWRPVITAWGRRDSPVGSRESSTLMPANRQILTCHQPSACSWWRCRGCNLIVKLLPRKNSLVRCTAIHLHTANRVTRQNKSESTRGEHRWYGNRKSPAYGPSSCKLSKTWVCTHVSLHGSGIRCHVRASSTSSVLLCTLLYSTV